MIELCLSLCLVFMQKYPSKVRASRSFKAESAEFISCKSGELITLISKDRHRYGVALNKLTYMHSPLCSFFFKPSIIVFVTAIVFDLQ